ncbi:unnamed protein product [Phyllotreta striolata]|uniref:Cilia- and flagella-associated protein 45 n=1 Tax=Phyllotreta striolata TaxID=444603 RepID=A0A9N9XTN2_PHYSR|nr:unnamed protein product [Phyllotreta striolata]
MDKFRFFKFSSQEKMGGDHSISDCGHSINGRPIHYKKKHALEGKNTYQAVGKNGVKQKIIPSRQPSIEPAIVCYSEFSRLKNQAKIVTPEERKARLDEAEREKSQKHFESQMRKEELKRSQKIQVSKPGGKLESLEEGSILLSRSQALQLEQDERVKQANSIILATKCRAIRHAQLTEKKLLEKELKEENKRLDLLMEQTRLEKVEAEEKRREEAERKRQRYIKEIQQQVREKEMLELFEAEKAEEECRLLNKVLVAQQKEEEQKAHDGAIYKRKLRDEFLKTTEEAEYFRTVREQEEKLREMRMNEFQRQKQEEEDARNRETAMKKAAIEREKERFLASHGKGDELKNMMEQFRLARSIEEKEKEWREKEKKEAEKRRAKLEELKKSRAEQIDASRKAQTVIIMRDKEDALKVAQHQRKLYDEHMAKEEKRREEKERHRLFLLEQINAKEKERIHFRMEKYEDGKAQRQEEVVMDKTIDDYLVQKIQGLRDLNMPENYIKDIERQVKAIKTK